MRSITRSATLAATALGAGALLALAGPVAAHAHVGITPDSTAAGSYSVLTFESSHGCGESPTTAFAVDIPEQVESVNPTLQAGWSVETVTAADDRVARVVYTADAPIEDGFRSTFEIRVKLPEDAEGERLEFPVLQTCVEGENDWSQSPGDDGEEPEYPAPSIEVTESTGDAHGHGAATDDEGDEGDEHADADTAAAANTAATDPADDAVDVLARVVGIAGLAVGVVGIVIAVAARRGAKA
jgi:uncharacterized protein YcnI